MSKAILEFKLPEEQEEFDEARLGTYAHLAIKDFYDEAIRKPLKYENISDSRAKVLEEVKKIFLEIMADYEIKF